jgi:hypothetical protein
MEKQDKPKFWMGSDPTKCQLCGKPITDEFIDGKTKFGPWAIMCWKCNMIKGPGLFDHSVTGAGQLYRKDELSELWIKVE